MKAIISKRPLPVSDPNSLIDVELPTPQASGRDILVRVEAISVNPVDTKVRASAEDANGIVLGWDAAGTVVAIGNEVTGFKPGDEVYYAGDITRLGTNSEYHLVDERIAGLKPAKLSFAEAAAFPLVTITAWEAIFGHLGVSPEGGSKGAILIIGGAGGVGSMGVQLARKAGLTVIATASRPETRDWVMKLGAHHVIDHRQPLPEQLAAIGLPEVEYIANFSNTEAYWPVMAQVIRPLGKIVAIVETSKELDLNLLKPKSVQFAWEFMFTRSKFQTPDMAEQGRLLDEAARWIDEGKLQSIVGATITGINAANLRAAHERSESGSLIGKLVLSGWSL